MIFSIILIEDFPTNIGLLLCVDLTSSNALEWSSENSLSSLAPDC